MRLVFDATTINPNSIAEAESIEKPSVFAIDSGLETPIQPLDKWPSPMGNDAFIGLAGEYVRLIEPQSEGDSAGLLTSFLVMFGNVVGSAPYRLIEDTKHHTNEFLVIVGDTAKARKGTTTNRSKSLFAEVNPGWAKQRIISGISSGEGLIGAVRDPKPAIGKQDADPGVEDKRCLIIQGEFAEMLHICRRDGNTVSAVMRDAWDSSALRITSKSNRDSCDHPHISLIGNITLEELERMLSTTDQANGFSNRILWCCSKRSKKISRPTPVDPTLRIELVHKLRKLIERLPTEAFAMDFDEQAYELWDWAYNNILEQEASGAFGKITARSSPHVVRLSMIYALLDMQPLIRVEHLKAALEVWRYCEDSARYIFGDSTGDLVVDTIYKAVMESDTGLTQTEISRLFKGHKPKDELNRATSFLASKGKITQVNETTAGKPITRWCKV